MIIQNNKDYIILISEDGMMLYRENIITPAVILGCNDFPENWKEITVEEAEFL